MELSDSDTWIRLNLDDGKQVYKYIHNPYSPTELDIFKMSYENLIRTQENSEQQAEAYRRHNLFEKVASFLDLRTDSICDESLEFLAQKAKKSPQDIIKFIESTEYNQLGEKSHLTPFSVIKRTDGVFQIERSIRELCGVNMREEEASDAMGQIQDQLSCSLSKEIFKDPVTCSSGYTFERSYIKKVIKEQHICPKTRIAITNYIVPNYALRSVLEKFVEKYQHQKGDIWESIVASCLKYKNFVGRLTDPEYVYEESAEYSESDYDLESESEDNSELEGRTEEQIQDFLNRNGYNNSYYDIPAIVASSRETSYSHAMRLADLIQQQPDMEEKMTRTGRTSEQIQDFLLLKGYSDDIYIQYIPDIVASSIDSSYRHAIKVAEEVYDEPT